MLLPLSNQFRNRLAIVCDKDFFPVRELSNQFRKIGLRFLKCNCCAHTLSQSTTRPLKYIAKVVEEAMPSHTAAISAATRSGPAL